jgi:hypothetical protein
MTDIDLTQYTTSSEAYDAGQAAFLVNNPEPTKPEKTFEIQRPALIEAGNGRLWVEVRQGTMWGGEPENPSFYLCSHDLSGSTEMEPAEIKALIDQLTVKLGELETAEKYKADYSAYQSAHRKWDEKKNQAGTIARTAWRALQDQLSPAPKPDDYSDEDIEDEDYEDSEDEDEDL